MCERFLVFLHMSVLGLLYSVALPSINPNAFADSGQVELNELDVWSVAFSPDNKFVIATTAGNGAVLIWERESCRLKSLYMPIPINDNLGSNNIIGIAWSPTKPEFATAMRDGSVRLWKLESAEGRGFNEKAVYTRSSSIEGNFSPGMRSVAFSPDGTLLAASGHGPWIYIWETDNASAPPHILDGQDDTINTVVFNRDNSTLISAGLDGTIRFWDLDHGKVVRTIKTPDAISNATVSLDSQFIAETSASTGAVVHRFDTGEEVRRFSIEGQNLWSLAFSPDTRFLAVGTVDDSQIHLFGLEQGREIWMTPFHQTPLSSRRWAIRGVAFSHDGKFILAGVSFDAPYLLDAKTGAILKKYGGGTCDFKK